MVTRKRKKSRKMRGSKTHGHGSKKKARGKGSKGGKGRAGMGKKAKHKRFLTQKERLFKKGGFYSRQREKNSINLGTIEENFDLFMKKGFIEKAEEGKYIFDAGKAGYDKILGGGNIRAGLEIKARFFSAKALEKISAVGSKAVIENE